jgi:hypothetical protein
MFVTNVTETRYCLPVNLNRFQEHLLRPHRKAAIPLLLPVDDEFFLGFAVPCHAEDRVLPAFEMTVAAWEDSGPLGPLSYNRTGLPQEHARCTALVIVDSGDQACSRYAMTPGGQRPRSYS